MKAPIIILFVVVTLFSVPGWSQPSVPRIQNPQITRPRQPDTKLNTNPSRPRPQTSGRPTIAPSDTTTTRVPPCGSCPDQVEITCRDLHRADGLSYGLVIMGTACPDNIALVDHWVNSDATACVEGQIVVNLEHICGSTGEVAETYVYGSGGDDRLDAILAGDHYIELYGGFGNDKIRGGNDTLIHGDVGADQIFASSGSLFGDEGNDKIHVGDGTGSAYGGAGNDEIIVDGNSSSNGENGETRGGDGNDCIQVLRGDAYALGENGNDQIAGGGRLYGGGGNDRLEATYAVVYAGNAVSGGYGNDRILASSAIGDLDITYVTTLDDGDGDDYIYGPYPNVYFERGRGRDTIVWDESNPRTYSEDSHYYYVSSCPGEPFCDESFYRPRDCVAPTW